MQKSPKSIKSKRKLSTIILNMEILTSVKHELSRKLRQGSKAKKIFAHFSRNIFIHNTTEDLERIRKARITTNWNVLHHKDHLIKLVNDNSVNSVNSTGFKEVDLKHIWFVYTFCLPQNSRFYIFQQEKQTINSLRNIGLVWPAIYIRIKYFKDFIQYVQCLKIESN